MNLPEQYRREHRLGLDYFIIPHQSIFWDVIASVDEGWEHISISSPNKTPYWSVMCFMKDLFWGDGELCIQFHPRKKDYINLHDHCLHIWKPPAEIIKLLETPYGE